MPIGTVIYAGNNSRLRNFALRNLHGGLVGYQARVLNSHHASQSNRKCYSVREISGATQEVEAPARLSRDHANPVWQLVSNTQIGTFVREDVVNASGALVIRRDASGMFQHVAHKFRELYQLPERLVRSFANVHDDQEEGGSEEDTREDFFDELGQIASAQHDFFAYSGHGGTISLPSACIRIRDLARLATAIRRLLKPTGTVLLYACSTGATGGFAEQLSGQLHGITVWGHIGAGTASRNPRKVKYLNGAKQRFLEDFTAEERSAWDTHIHDDPNFYAQFAFMTIDEIKRAIRT